MTKVVFRKWRDIGGDVIALFPEVSADNAGRYCDSYEHIGQSGGADYTGVITATRSATPAEYADLLAELRSIGYDDLVIRARYTRAIVRGVNYEQDNLCNNKPETGQVRAGIRGTS